MKFFITLILALSIFSCQSNESPLIRPRQFPKVEFPTQSYTTFESDRCPFKVNIPQYSQVEQKEYLFDNIPAGQCWFDIIIPEFEATIHCSYFELNKKNEYAHLVNDAFTMAGKHNIKATFREEFNIENQFGSRGLIFKINGPVATPYQFYISDSTNHFLRGSLYFDNDINSDSISPIVNFLRKDIDMILSSLQWE